ncbi:MAG TPA: hypothetical protein VI248_28670 [Kineosporiaceae bacterium]
MVVSPWDPSGDMAWYVFDCVGCVERVVKRAERSAVSALTLAHAAVSIIPREVAERAGSGEQAPLTTDDLLDAMLWLRTCDEPGTAITGPRGATP